MLRFWRRSDAAAEIAVPSTPVDQLSPHLRRDSESPGRGGFFIDRFHPESETSPGSIILRLAPVIRPVHSPARFHPHSLRRTPC